MKEIWIYRQKKLDSNLISIIHLLQILAQVLNLHEPMPTLQSCYKN